MRILPTALEAEQRLERAGLPIKKSDVWLKHRDAVCEAFWSCRHKAEKTLAEFHPNRAVGAVQYFKVYEDRIKKGGYLLAVHVEDSEKGEVVRDILKKNNLEDISSVSEK